MTTLIQPGDAHTLPFSYDQATVDRFAAATGDDNPLHHDAAYAATTPFRRPIMHGFLGASVFSKVFGTLFPGPGTVYLEQSLVFKRPMYVDTPYTSVCRVVSVDRPAHRAVVATVVHDERGRTTLEGQAVIMHQERI